MARTLIAYICLIFLIQVCKFQINVPRYYPAYFKVRSNNLRQGANEPQNPQDPKSNSKVGDTDELGPIPDPHNQDGCYCNQIYDPVCGSNNQSYYNKCQLSCETADSVTVVHQGKCIPF